MKFLFLLTVLTQIALATEVKVAVHFDDTCGVFNENPSIDKRVYVVVVEGREVERIEVQYEPFKQYDPFVEARAKARAIFKDHYNDGECQ